jgi:hypothetical protein
MKLENTGETISLKVSIPYALDYLSILQVKAGKGIATQEYVDCYNQLQEALDLANIVQLPEYKELVRVNLHMFDVLESDFDGDQIRECNKERFEAKKAIGKALSVSYNEVKTVHVT